VQTTLSGPSSAPSFELPRRAALRALPHGAEWDSVGREAADLLAEYLRINTTNPPGHEVVAARWLQGVLQREGIETELLEPAPGKANLVARLRGDGSARPLVLLNHIDVVEASPEFWTVDPFGGVRRDGYLYGRGALDMKGEGIAQLMAVLLLRRAGVPLARDVIWLATSDEEVGGGVGASWIFTQRPDLVRGAEFLLNEGGSARADATGAVTYVGIGVTEKAPFWLTVTARGTAGHGSRPTGDNAVERLVRALARVEGHQTPFRVTPAAERFFRGLAGREPDPARRAWLADVAAALREEPARRFFASDPYYNAILRNTVSITRLAGSGKVNVIPPVARAELDVRLLPGQDPQAFLAELRALIDDTLVTIEPQGVSWPATESGAETAMYRVIAEVSARHFPNALVVPTMLTGFTDSHYFRRLGIASYGLSPFPVSEADARGVHGNDERIALAALTRGVRYLFEIVAGIAAR
jgi:acetylornithine deacetylase/succinyl-diaminopimelate desuccinylase-like protein